MQNTTNIRLVHTSQGSASRGRSPDTTYHPSMHSHRVSLGHIYVLCCVLISVVMGRALWAIPFTNPERQLFIDVPTLGAHFTGREESVNNLQRLPVSLALVGQLASEHSEPDIGDCASETVVSQHAPDIQVFNSNHIESSDEISGEFVKSVRPLVGNVLMQSGHFDSLRGPSTTTPLPSSKHSLKSGEFSQVRSKISRIGNPISIGKCGQPADTKINPNVQPSLRKLLDRFVEAEGDKVFPGRFLDYRYRRGIAFEFSTPMNIESTKARDCKIPVDRIPLECTLGVFGGLSVALFLEGWVLTELRPESKKCCLKMSERLLSRNTGHFIEPFGFLLFLEGCEHSRSLVIGDSFLLCSPGFGSYLESPVVDVATATKDPEELLSLSGCRIESESVSRFHAKNIYCVKSNNQGERGCGNSSND